MILGSWASGTMGYPQRCSEATNMNGQYKLQYCEVGIRNLRFLVSSMVKTCWNHDVCFVCCFLHRSERTRVLNTVFLTFSKLLNEFRVDETTIKSSRRWCPRAGSYGDWFAKSNRFSLHQGMPSFGILYSVLLGHFGTAPNSWMPKGGKIIPTRLWGDVQPHTRWPLSWL